MVKITDIKAGDLITIDDGFTCVSSSEHVVLGDDAGGLYFLCEDGRHFLDGQEDLDGTLSGVVSVYRRSSALNDIQAERRRQVDGEGFTESADDAMDWGQIAQAAAAYALHSTGRFSQGRTWPWEAKWWKPSGPRRDLVKAGALIVAEIERLDRIEAAVSVSRSSDPAESDNRLRALYRSEGWGVLAEAAGMDPLNVESQARAAFAYCWNTLSDEARSDAVKAISK